MIRRSSLSRVLLLFLAALICFIAVEAKANQSCREAVKAAEDAFGIPADLLMAMNQVETLWSNQAWPWSLNISGKPRRYKDDRSMTRALNEVIARTDNVDIGCMQINWRWVGKSCATDPRLLVDPRLNAKCSAMYLTSLYRQLGSWHKAVKAYHVGPNRTDKTVQRRADRYVCKVGKEYALLLGQKAPCNDR